MTRRRLVHDEEAAMTAHSVKSSKKSKRGIRNADDTRRADGSSGLDKTRLHKQNGRVQSGAIQDFFNLEDLLYKIVLEANEILAGDGCSIFLWDDDLGRFVLRESTVMTPYIGKYSLDHTKYEESARCGITTRVAITGEPYLSADVRKDPYWHWYRLPKRKRTQTDLLDPC